MQLEDKIVTLEERLFSPTEEDRWSLDGYLHSAEDVQPVLDALDNGTLPGRKIGYRWFFLRSDFMKWIHAGNRATS